jgi:hypothetical protein
MSDQICPKCLKPLQACDCTPQSIGLVTAGLFPSIDALGNYHQAVLLRLEAERGSDPAAYDRAADALLAAGMPNSAAACRERAGHYRKMQEQQA